MSSNSSLEKVTDMISLTLSYFSVFMFYQMVVKNRWYRNGEKEMLKNQVFYKNYVGESLSISLDLLSEENDFISAEI